MRRGDFSGKNDNLSTYLRGRHSLNRHVMHLVWLTSAASRSWLKCHFLKEASLITLPSSDVRLCHSFHSKKHTCVSYLQFCRSGVLRVRSLDACRTGLKCRRAVFLEALEEQPLPPLFQLLEAAGHCWLTVPFSIFPSSHSELSLYISLLPTSSASLFHS